MASIDEIEIADEPERWAALGFDVDGDICRLGSVNVRLSGAQEGEGLRGWSLRDIATEDLDGLSTARSGAVERDPAPSHPNGVLAIDHVVAFSGDLDRTVAVLQGAGLDLRRIREEPTPAGAPRQAFFRLGREILEVVQVRERALERSGGAGAPARLWGLALLAEDVDGAAAAIPGSGRPRDAVQPGRRIVTFGPRCGAVGPRRADQRGGGGVSEERWRAVDDFIEGALIGEDPVLERALRESARAGLPPIAVTASQGRFLNLLLRIHGASRVLELGTLGGYSTIWLGRALPPDGRILTLELDAGYAAVARENLRRAGLAETVEVRVGAALDSMGELRREGGEPFDAVFIDADKARTPEYFLEALELVRPGALIVADNSVRGGAVADPDSADAGAQGMRRFMEIAGAEGRVSATTIQTVGAKGYDGFTLVLVES